MPSKIEGHGFLARHAPRLLEDVDFSISELDQDSGSAGGFLHASSKEFTLEWQLFRSSTRELSLHGNCTSLHAAHHLRASTDSEV